MKKMKKIKKKKSLSKEEQKKIDILDRAKKLRSSLKIKLDGFSKKHHVYLPCFPYGLKKNNKGEIASTFFRQHIYLCKTLCENKCPEFLAKTYLCSDIGCNNYPICVRLSPEDRKETCKKKFLQKERVLLNESYNRYLHFYSIFRGLKIDPEKTLKFLDQQKLKKVKEDSIHVNVKKKIKKKIKKETKKETKENGKIPDQKSLTTRKTLKRKKDASN
jgi:hypothetical protein